MVIFEKILLLSNLIFINFKRGCIKEKGTRNFILNSKAKVVLELFAMVFTISEFSSKYVILPKSFYQRKRF